MDIKVAAFTVSEKSSNTNVQIPVFDVFCNLYRKFDKHIYFQHQIFAIILFIFTKPKIIITSHFMILIWPNRYLSFPFSVYDYI